MNHKNKFGSPHRKYGSEPKLCKRIRRRYNQLLNDPFTIKKTILSKLSREFGIPRTTIWRWSKRWNRDMNYDPSDMKVHGTFNRIFTDEQENSIVEYIDEVYIKLGKYFPDFFFQSLIFEAYDDIYQNSPTAPHFQCSPGFIQDFKERHRISSRIAHFRQRPINKSEQKILQEIELFKSKIKTLIEKARNSEEPVINADESGFQILPTSIKTWSFKNAKNVSINVSDSDKDRISIMASITSDYEKLPLFIIGKGESLEDAQENLGQIFDNNYLTFSSKSYMNSECFVQYLNFLRKQYDDNRKIHLILDSYSSHTSKLSIETAKKLNIDLYFIPSHFTDVLQPLDIAIFAPLKSKANSKIRRLLLNDRKSPIGMETSVVFLQEAWDDLSISALVNAWDLYI